MRLHLVDALAETTVNQVSVDMGSLREEVSWVSAGNLASLSLTGEVKAGETLVDLAHKAGMVPFEGISYVSEPVVTLAVEPKNPKDIPMLLEALKKLASEDPNLKVDADQQTGEYLLSGMGELASGGRNQPTQKQRRLGRYRFFTKSCLHGER